MTTRRQTRTTGTNCPFDVPRSARNEYWDLVGTLEASSLYLTRNQAYRGQCLLIFDPRHVTRLDELKQGEWAAFSADLRVAHDSIVRALNPDHMNVALLGNIISHLHWHIVPRYRLDPRWGSPIWTTQPAEMVDVHLSDEEREKLVATIRHELSGSRAG